MACAETCLIGIAPPAAEIVICDLTDNQLISPFRFSGPDDRSIYVDANTRIQIIETMMDLPTADKEQNAAFVVSLFISGCICTSFFRVPFSCHVVSRGMSRCDAANGSPYMRVLGTLRARRGELVSRFRWVLGRHIAGTVWRVYTAAWIRFVVRRR